MSRRPWWVWVLLLPVGWAVLTVGLRVWEGGLSEREALHRLAVREVLAGSKAWRRQVDSLRAREGAALAQARALARDREVGRVALARLRDSLVLEARSASGAPVVRLAEALGLVGIGNNRWATDSAGVRRLESLRLRAVEGELVIPALERQVGRLEAEVDQLLVAHAAASERAERAEARIQVLEPLLQEAQRLRRCRIAGLLPCPSRTVAFLGGVLVTVAIMATPSRQ